MAPVRRNALVRRHEAPRPTARSPWPRHSGRSDATSLPPDNQIVRGLLIGVPLGVAIWLALALIVWWLV